MIPTSKVLWGEGLFLRPQHFQRQDAYHEWRLAEAMRSLHPYAWGVRRLKVDVDGLHSGVLRLEDLALVFGNGQFFSASSEDELPPASSLAAWPEQRTELVFHVAVAELRNNGRNCALHDKVDDGSMHYRRSALRASDQYTEADPAELVLLRPSVRLLGEHELREGLVTMPVCRLRRTASGGFELDARFVPPAMSIQAAPALLAMLRRQLDMLQAKVDALYGFHREPTKHVVEIRSGDAASFWLLHTCSSAHAALGHLRHNPLLHPERLFERLLELAGALMTFSKNHTLSALPQYQHAAPGPAFQQLDDMIRELLETVISTRYFAIPLNESKPSFHNGRLASDRITASTAFYIGINAGMPATELVDTLRPRLKVGAPDDVDQAVATATSGVKLSHVQQVPGAIPVRPGAVYFALEPRGPLYERMLQAQAITVYVPGGVPELKLELFALNL